MIFATKNTGLFLWRHEFEHKLLCMDALLSNIWDPDQLPSCTAPKTTQEFSLMLQLLIQSIKWFEQYESWVLDTCGQASYRNETIQDMYSHEILNIRLDKSWKDLAIKFEEISGTIKIKCQ